MKETNNRLMSLDALRGFDMFFITGGSALITGLCAGFGVPDCWLARQMVHVPWAGLTHHDTIYPLFLFLAGVSWPFSLAVQQAKGRTSGEIHRKVFVRALTLFLIELSLSRILKFDPEFRLMGVLSYIGLSWGLAALLFMHVVRIPFRMLSIGAMLIGYWAILTFTLAPGAPIGADSHSMEWNIVSYMDRTLWPQHLMRKGVYEPESIFALSGGVALAMIGMCAGAVLRNDRLSKMRRVGVLLASAFGFLVLAFVFVSILREPIVKALWTPSFILSAATISLALLALFYWIVDVRGWSRWAFLFRIVGMNSILIYLMMRLRILHLLGDFLLGGLAEWVGSPWTGAIRSLGMLAAGWIVLYYLYRKKVFLKA